jgi:cation diffusion facilitator family transporter
MFAMLMVWESVTRLIYPVDIAFNQAILIAIIGLIVNGVSVFILGHEHVRDADDENADGSEAHARLDSSDDAEEDRHHHDHNLRAAYLHVLADALTSLLAIAALLAGKYFGLIWMDPLMGVVGAFLVARWSVALLRTTSALLLDRQGPAWVQTAIRESVERVADTRVADLHVWSIGPNIYALELVVVADRPQSPAHYKTLLPKGLGLVHVNVEVHNGRTQEPAN